MFNPLNSLVCSCITPYSNLIRLALYFKKISFSALSGSSRARRSVMTPPAVLKRRSEGTKRLSTVRLRYPVPGTILAGTGTGLEKMAGYPADRNRNRISGTSLELFHMEFGHRYTVTCIASAYTLYFKKLQACIMLPII